MKLFVFFIAVLPFALGARLDERFLEGFTGGYDIFGLAAQIASQFGCDETERQCESTLCPNIVDKIDFHNHLITGLVCTSVCHQVQVLAQEVGSGAASASGVDPCVSSVGKK